MKLRFIILIASLVALPILYWLVNLIIATWEKGLGRPYPYRKYVKPFFMLYLIVVLITFAL